MRDFPKFKEDFGIVKRTYIGETVNIEFRFEWFNAFNRTTLGFGRFGGGSTNISNPATFGKVNRQENSMKRTLAIPGLSSQVWVRCGGSGLAECN